MIDIIVRDYQAVEEAKLNIKGITVLKGVSNGGKSSLMKALRSTVMNRFRAGTVRYGKEFTEVKMRFDGTDIIECRKPIEGSPIYKLKGQRYTKLNRDLPKEISDFFNFPMLNISSTEKYSLNFYPQFQPPLLYDFSQKRIMDVLSASKELDLLNQVKKELDVRRLENKAEFNNLETILNESKAAAAITALALKDLEPVDEIKANLDRLTEIADNLSAAEELDTVIAQITNMQQQVEVLQRIYTNEVARTQVVDSLCDLNELHEILSEDLERKQEILKSLLISVSTLEQVRESQNDLNQLEECSNPEPSIRLSILERLLLSVTALSETREKLGLLSELEKTSVQGMEVKKSRLEKMYNLLVQIDDNKAKKVQNTHAEQDLSSLETLFQVIKQDTAAYNSKKLALETGVTNCPLCNSKISII